MCGILGQVGEFPLDRALFEGALHLQRHRGPDDQAVKYGDKYALGVRRLSIIDLSVAARQPMTTKDQQILLVFNGEIYNYMEMRQDLQTKGYTFRTQSDTEVLLIGYQHYGIDVIHKLTGMFAFGIVDRRRDEVFLARDRVGIKPLYTYIQGSKSVIFSSEIKSILTLVPEARRINTQAISSYLLFRRPVLNDTFFQDIMAVPPGYYLRISLSDIKDMQKVQYWDHAEYYQGQKEDRGEAYYLAELRELMESSVRYHMISDVPVGSFLSGGVDSSVLTAIMAQQSGDPINTFTVGYSEPGYDEYSYSSLVADRYHTSHHEIRLDQTEYLDPTSFLIRQKEAPLLAPHEVSLFKMSQATKRHVKVVLSGEGADELFAGYGRLFRSPYDFRRIRGQHDLADWETEKFQERYKSQYGSYCFDNEIDHFMFLYSYLKPQDTDFLIFPDVMGNTREIFADFFADLFARVSSDEYENKMMYTFTKVHLVGLLERADTATMAASVEARVPFVDHRLVEFSAQVPLRYKLRWQSEADARLARTLTSDEISERHDIPKYILKRAYEADLPRDVLYRTKSGFPVPLDRWLNGESREYAKTVLLDKSTVERGIVQTANIETWLDEKEAPLTHSRALKIWMLINLEIFFRECL